MEMNSNSDEWKTTIPVCKKKKKMKQNEQILPTAECGDIIVNSSSTIFFFYFVHCFFAAYCNKKSKHERASAYIFQDEKNMLMMVLYNLHSIRHT